MIRTYGIAENYSKSFLEFSKCHPTDIMTNQSMEKARYSDLYPDKTKTHTIAFLHKFFMLSVTQLRKQQGYTSCIS